MAAIFGEGKFFCKLTIEHSLNTWQVEKSRVRVCSLDTLWVENFDEIALSRTVSEIDAILFFSALRKIVAFSKSLISRPFCIGSLRKVNDFQACI